MHITVLFQQKARTSPDRFVRPAAPPAASPSPTQAMDESDDQLQAHT